MVCNVKTVLFVLLTVLFPSVLKADDIRREMMLWADSAQKIEGEPQLPVVNARWMKLARQLNDTLQIELAYRNHTMHYYALGHIDSLKIASYKLMDWCVACNKPEGRYTAWRQYIQRLTEKGMQEEAMAETELLRQDAEKVSSKFGIACASMCTGYNHRVFANNVKQCIDCYNYALKLFQENEYYYDAYVVLLNIVQTHLSRSDYEEANKFLAKLQQLEDDLNKMTKSSLIGASLHLRFLEFSVIGTLATKGRQAAKKLIDETDRYYTLHPTSSTKEAWFAYKIMCARVNNDLKGNISYVDSLIEYQQSIGACYPYNYFMKAQLQEEIGQYKAACANYQMYAALNDSVNSAELADKLGKYTAQFEVDKLKMEKLELNAKINRDRYLMVLMAGVIVLCLLFVISYLYYRTLSVNRKLEAARKAVQKMSQVKSSFIQHITHELRTPLNSIIGFSTLLVEGEADTSEAKEYASQIEQNNVYLLGLMENILVVADMDSQVLEQSHEMVDVQNCCKECIDSLRSVLKPGVALECHSAAGVPPIYAVRSSLKTVLTTLIDNAMKFTDEGTIRVSCSEDKVRNVLIISVEDTGIGIDQQYANRIFERFFKIDTFTKGSGLGLAIAREVTLLAGGTVYWDSTYQGGSRFVVEWPIKKEI